MPKATITTKGQVTIPKRVRDQLGLRSGDTVEFRVEDDEHAVMRPARVSVLELKGILYDPNRKPLSLDEMDEAVRKHAVERHGRH